MTPYEDDTAIGGAEAQFPETEWTKILDPSKRATALDELLIRYWKPLYCYLRREGFGNEEAKDLIQGFLAQIVLGRDLIGKADQSKGRFRNLLLVALENYSKSVYRPKKRRRQKDKISLEQDDLPATAPAEPGQAFVYGWAVKLIDQALIDLKKECFDNNEATHWQAFNERFLKPIRDNIKAPLLKEICSDYGIEDEAKASNMIITVKRRFRSLLKLRIRQHVDSDAEVEEEINDLIKILSQGGAG